MWIDTPESRRTATHANRWLLFGFFTAYELQNNVHIAGEVDDLLLNNLKGINRILNTWFKKLSGQCLSRTAIEHRWASRLQNGFVFFRRR